MVQIVWSLLAAAVAVDAIPGYGACPASDKCLGAIKAHENAAKEYCISALEKTVTSGQPWYVLLLTLLVPRTLTE